jgi:hypothetical protein
MRVIGVNLSMTPILQTSGTLSDESVGMLGNSKGCQPIAVACLRSGEVMPRTNAISPARTPVGPIGGTLIIAGLVGAIAWFLSHRAQPAIDARTKARLMPLDGKASS